MSYTRISKVLAFMVIFTLLTSASFMQNKSTAKIKFLIGKAEILSKNQTDWRTVKLNMIIKSGDRIKTLLNARVEIDMPDGTLIKVNENSIFDVKEIRTVEQDKEDKMSFTLWAGNIWARFKKVVNTRQARQIESPSAVVAIRGTTLDMNVDNNQSTTVRVFEGSVSVISKDAEGEVIVGTNQETTVDKGRAPTSPQTIKDANIAINNLKAISEKINSGQGTIGQLLTNDSLYFQLEKSTSNLNKLLEDLRLNPKRYVKFSLF